MLAFVVEVVDGIAVGEYNGLVVPFPPQDINEQTVAGTTGYTLVAVVGAHHFAYVALLYQCLEGG